MTSHSDFRKHVGVIQLLTIHTRWRQSLEKFTGSEYHRITEREGIPKVIESNPLPNPQLKHPWQRCSQSHLKNLQRGRDQHIIHSVINSFNLYPVPISAKGLPWVVVLPYGLPLPRDYTETGFF